MSLALNSRSPSLGAPTLEVENQPGTMLGRVWPWLLFAFPWLDLFRQLSFQWAANEQYAYGWFVPFLTLGLLWKRWRQRPVPQGQASPGWLVVLVVVLGLSLLPVRLVYEINPDWPVPSWMMALIVAGISLYAVFLMGGWRWVGHFLFPVCFTLLAVRWPFQIEHRLTHGLMRMVVSLTVHVLSCFDVMAFPSGNLIEVSTGLVGIDEACSGIRSFQSTLMAALFLGEFYALRGLPRLGLLVGGVVLAFSLNVVRTLILTWQASVSGLETLEKWHDPAGMTIFLVSLLCLWGLAGFMKKKGALWARNRKSWRVDPKRSSSRGDLRSGTSTGQAEATSQPPLVIPRRYLMAVGCWALGVVAVTEIWYQSHESKATSGFAWSPAFPTNNASFVEMELTPSMRRNLHYDLGRSGQWKLEDGTQWSGFFFRWNPKSFHSLVSARLHRPDVCLPSHGLRQVADAGVDTFKIGTFELPFRKYTYELDRQRIHVFFCLSEDSTEKQKSIPGSSRTDRLRAVLAGRRNLGQQSFEIVLYGYGSLGEAEQALRQRLPELIATPFAKL